MVGDWGEEEDGMLSGRGGGGGGRRKRKELVWRRREGATPSYYVAVATSYDGLKLAAVQYLDSTGD